MPFKPKDTKEKKKSRYRTLYMSEELFQKIDKIARENGTSFNNTVISMLEYCVEMEQRKRQKESTKKRGEAQRNAEKRKGTRRSAKKCRETQRNAEKRKEAQRNTEKRKGTRRSAKERREAQRSKKNTKNHKEGKTPEKACFCRKNRLFAIHAIYRKKAAKRPASCVDKFDKNLE